MRKFSIIPLLFLLLASCGNPTVETQIQSPTISVTPSMASGMPCTVVGGTSNAAEELQATINQNDHSLGPEDAPVTILVYSDFQCPFCSYVARNIHEVQLAHPLLIRLVFRYFPLVSAYDKSLLAIQAVEAAGIQGKFWEMHDLLFQEQSNWTDLAPGEFQNWVEAQAGGLGMDRALFQSDYGSDAVKTIAAGAAQFTVGIDQASPPLLFINSTQTYTGPVDFPDLESVVSLFALARSQFISCPTMAVNPLHQYLATLHTTQGDLVVLLYPDKAPLAVNSFIYLARASWYDGSPFYRVTATVAQTGDPSGTGLGNPGYLFPVENSPGINFDRPGVVALMNDGAGTNGSRFFITRNVAPQLDGQYTIIGQVISGLENLSKLQLREPMPGEYLPPGDLLLEVDIEEK